MAAEKNWEGMSVAAVAQAKDIVRHYLNKSIDVQIKVTVSENLQAGTNAAVAVAVVTLFRKELFRFEKALKDINELVSPRIDGFAAAFHAAFEKEFS